MKKYELTPPDRTQCQAEKADGFMVLGGNHRRHRCTNKPIVVVTERQVGKDGQRGSMSLCEECKGVFEQRFPPSYVKFEPIRERKRYRRELTLLALLQEARDLLDPSDPPTRMSEPDRRTWDMRKRELFGGIEQAKRT